MGTPDPREWWREEVKGDGLGYKWRVEEDDLGRAFLIRCDSDCFGGMLTEEEVNFSKYTGRNCAMRIAQPEFGEGIVRPNRTL